MCEFIFIKHIKNRVYYLTFVLIYMLPKYIRIISSPGLCLTTNNFNKRPTSYIQISESVPPHTDLTKIMLRSKHLS